MSHVVGHVCVSPSLAVPHNMWFDTVMMDCMAGVMFGLMQNSATFWHSLHDSQSGEV
jgi:hypothetical protein